MQFYLQRYSYNMWEFKGKNKIPFDHFWSMIMDELVDLEEERLLALYALMRQKKIIAETYN